MDEAKQSTPHDVLIGELLDSRIPKNEREWAAAREIEELRLELKILAKEVERLWPFEAQQAELNVAKAFHNVAVTQRDAAWREVENLKAENKNLQTNIEKLQNIMKHDIQDWCEEDEKIRQQAMRILPEEKINGDSWHVPRMVELVEMITDEAVNLQNQLKAKNNF